MPHIAIIALTIYQIFNESPANFSNIKNALSGLISTLINF